jgi:hypothetical protein
MVVTSPEHRAEAERIWKLPAGTIPATPGVSRRRHVPARSAAMLKAAVGSNDQSVGDAPEPLALRAHSPTTAASSSSAISIQRRRQPSPTLFCRLRPGLSVKACSAIPSGGHSTGRRWSIRREKPARTRGR